MGIFSFFGSAWDYVTSIFQSSENLTDTKENLNENDEVVIDKSSSIEEEDNQNLINEDVKNLNLIADTESDEVCIQSDNINQNQECIDFCHFKDIHLLKEYFANNKNDVLTSKENYINDIKINSNSNDLLKNDTRLSERDSILNRYEAHNKEALDQLNLYKNDLKENLFNNESKLLSNEIYFSQESQQNISLSSEAEKNDNKSENDTALINLSFIEL